MWAIDVIKILLSMKLSSMVIRRVAVQVPIELVWLFYPCVFVHITFFHSGCDGCHFCSHPRSLHVHLPLHVGDVRSVLESFDRPVGARKRKRPNYIRWLQGSLLLAETQHTRGDTSIFLYSIEHFTHMYDVRCVTQCGGCSHVRAWLIAIQIQSCSTIFMFSCSLSLIAVKI